MSKTKPDWITVRIETKGQRRLKFRVYLDEANLPVRSIRVEDGVGRADYELNGRAATIKLDNRSAYHEERRETKQ